MQRMSALAARTGLQAPLLGFPGEAGIADDCRALLRRLRCGPRLAAGASEILRGIMIEWGTSPQRAENPIPWNHLEIDTKRPLPLAEKS
jgi:hypothetical protein